MHTIIIQRASREAYSPPVLALRQWAKNALGACVTEECELTIRIVSAKEMIELNTTYRHKPKVTNVLSFPFELPEHVDMGKRMLGDIVICAAVIQQEAIAQGKSIDSHWAHMVIHGILHLLGYDHEIEKAAVKMEALEIQLLISMGFNNPYTSTREIPDNHDT